MKKSLFIFLLLLVFYSLAFAKDYDTTFKANLIESKNNIVKISYQYDEKEEYFTGKFTVNIDGISILDSTESSGDVFETKIVDLDKNDEYKEIAITSYFNDISSYQLFHFTEKKIINLGTVYSMEQPLFTGKGNVKCKKWMGFWILDFEYVLNEDKMKLEEKYKDEYPIKFYEENKMDIIAKEDFNIYKERNKKSDIAVKLKEGEKIKVLKAYIKVTCEDEYKDWCFWYLLENKDKKKGWIQLKDFQDKVSGLPWAG
jgi:hypothetical protein